MLLPQFIAGWLRQFKLHVQQMHFNSLQFWSCSSAQALEGQHEDAESFGVR